MDMKTYEILKALYKRAGYSSYESLAAEMGYKKRGSSIQRYFSEGGRKGKYLPPELVERFAKAFVGHGNPSITEAEVWMLAGSIEKIINKEIQAAHFNNVGELWNLYKAATPEIQHEFDVLHADHIKKKTIPPKKEKDRAA